MLPGNPHARADPPAHAPRRRSPPRCRPPTSPVPRLPSAPLSSPVSGYEVHVDLRGVQASDATTFHSTHDRALHPATQPAAATFIDPVAPPCTASASTAPPGPGRALRRHPDPAPGPRGRERPLVVAARPVHEHRRRPAPLRGPGGQRGLPVHPVRGPGRRACSPLRTARPEGQLHVHRHRALRTGMSCPTRRPRSPEPRRRGAAHVARSPRPAASSLCHRARRRAVPVVRNDVTAAAAGPRWASSAAGRSRRSSMPTSSSSSPGRASSSSRPSSAAPYPFEKYDQLFVPGVQRRRHGERRRRHHPGGLRLPRQVTDAAGERRAITVLHELAHMWFGDLVTMRWWNDLWLNESFAEYVSTSPPSRTPSSTDAWTTFASLEKSWAYRQDQLPSTHPIFAEINDLRGRRGELRRHHLRQGRLGAQAARRLGRAEQFSPGCAILQQARLGQHQPRDLLAELEKASGRDLKAGRTLGWRRPA